MSEIYLFVLLVYLLTVPTLYWVFKDENEINKGKKRIAVILLVVFYTLIALIPSFEGKNAYYHFGFLAFPLLYSILLKKHFRKMIPPPSKMWAVFIIIFLLFWFEEMVLSIGHVINGAYNNGFYSILTHLIGYLGFYFGVALTIVFFCRKWNFSLWQLFTAGGIWGLIWEQQLLGPIMLLSGDFFSFIIFASFVFPVYGLLLVGPRLLFSEELKSLKKSRWQSLLLFVGIFLIPLIFWALFNWVFGIIGLDISGVI